MSIMCVWRAQAPMQPPKALRMPETEETTEEFVSAELEMLAMGAKSIPPSSSLGALSWPLCCMLLLLVSRQSSPKLSGAFVLGLP